MEINQLQQTEFVDLFPSVEGQVQNTPLKFGAVDNLESIDILSTTETTTLDSTTETTTISSTDETTTLAPVEPDILGDGKKSPGRPPKVELKDMSSYFEDRFKSGKLISIEEEIDGVKTNFIPKTPEEVDEVIEIQVNYRLDKEKEKLNENWYASKSPAWQAVAKYAELTDDPTEILPFLQGVKTIESVSQIDPTDPDGAEKIVRVRLEQRGDEEDVILEQIDALKTANKLISTAEKYKPLIVKQEQHQLAKLVNDQKVQEQQYNELISNIRENAIKAIEAPIFGKQKLKQEEKAAVYHLIGHPDEETKGYAIYTAIDQMFENGNFETLKKIALLIAKEEAFINYISTGAANKVADNLQRTLRVAGERSSGGNDQDAIGDKKTVSRDRYSSHPRFGR